MFEKELQKSRYARLIKFNGAEKKLKPVNGKYFDLKEFQQYIDGVMQVVPLPTEEVLVCIDGRKAMGCPINELATNIWNHIFPSQTYPMDIKNDGYLVGNVIICPLEMLKCKGYG